MRIRLCILSALNVWLLRPRGRARRESVRLTSTAAPSSLNKRAQALLRIGDGSRWLPVAVAGAGKAGPAQASSPQSSPSAWSPPRGQARKPSLPDSSPRFTRNPRVAARLWPAANTPSRYQTTPSMAASSPMLLRDVQPDVLDLYGGPSAGVRVEITARRARIARAVNAEPRSHGARICHQLSKRHPSAIDEFPAFSPVNAINRRRGTGPPGGQRRRPYTNPGTKRSERTTTRFRKAPSRGESASASP